MINTTDLEAMGYFDQFDTPQQVDLDDYAEWVEDKILTEGDNRVIENTMGFFGEAGEFFEKLKKFRRDGTKVSKEDLTDEAGDILFYFVAILNNQGIKISDVVRRNIVKLDDRQRRGKLKGSGDNR